MSAPQLHELDACRLDYLLASCSNEEGRLTKSFSEAEIQEVRDMLVSCSNDAFQDRPRLFIILYHIKELARFDHFVRCGVTDRELPYDADKIPDDLFDDPDTKDRFLHCQNHILSDGFDLDRPEGRHAHFESFNDVPLIRDVAKDLLGQGAFGRVYRVRSSISYKTYALKTIRRDRHASRSNLELLETEIEAWKRLSHPNIVQFEGSYTVKAHFGILMTPVADCNLKSYLQRHPFPELDKPFLRSTFGCLASAVAYLHQNDIRHRDIKPPNILIKENQVFLSDFGIARDFSMGNQSEFSYHVLAFKPRYGPPETDRRGRPADMWSLGCVFLDIWSVIKGVPFDFLHTFLEICGERIAIYSQNFLAFERYIHILEKQEATLHDNHPADWIKNLMTSEPDERLVASELVERITIVNSDPKLRKLYSGHCCLEDPAYIPVQDETQGGTSLDGIASNLQATRSDGPPAGGAEHVVRQHQLSGIQGVLRHGRNLIRETVRNGLGR